MDPGAIEMGPQYGCHGQYTFYKAFRYLIPGRWVTVSKGKFFFVNSRSSSNDLSLCIGEIQLIWTTRSEPQDPLSSLRLYFMPEQSPEGRKQYHGQDELLAAEDKIIIRVKDLISWLVTEGVSWSAGFVFPAVLNDEPAGTQLVDCPVVITSYSKYCRLMSLEKRIESIMPSPEKAIYAFAVRAVCGIAGLSSQSRVMFCRETFRHRDLEDHELRCDHLAPNLKGRPRSRHRLKTIEAPGDGVGGGGGDHEYVPLNALLPKTKRGRPRKGVLSEAVLRAEGPFLKAVYSFMKERGTPIHRIPSIGFKKIDLFVFYKTAEKLGGYKQICMKRSWKKLHDKIGGNPGSTSAATCTRKHYERLLLPFEEHVRSCKSNKATNLVSSKCLTGSLATRPKLAQSSYKDVASSTHKGSERGKAAELRPGGMLSSASLVAVATMASSTDVNLSCTEQPDRTISSEQAKPRCQSGKRLHGEQSCFSRLPATFSSVRHSDAPPESWPLTRRPAPARLLPPPPPLLADGVTSADRRSHDTVTRPTEPYLEAALRYSDMTPAAAAAEVRNRHEQHQQQQQRLFVPIFSPYPSSAASYNGVRPAVQSPDGRFVVTTSTAVQFLPSSHEQLVSATDGVVNAGLLFAGDVQRSHLLKPELDISTCAVAARPSQQPLLVTGARGGLPMQYSLCIDGKLTSVVGKQQHPYFTAVIGADACSDIKTTGPRIQTSVATSDRPLDLTCKTPLRPWTATVMPAILSSSRTRKQPPSSGKPNAEVVVVTSAVGSATAAATASTAEVVPALHSTTAPAKVEFAPGIYECRASPPRLPSDSAPLQKSEALIVRHTVLDGLKSSQLSILSSGRASDSDVVGAVALSSQQTSDAVLYRTATHTVLPSAPSPLVISSSSARHAGLPTHQGKQAPLLPQHLVRSLMTRSQH